jgi:hypothetical protein
MQSTLIMNAKKQIKPDENRLTLLVGDDEEQIGVVKFDLAKFLDQKPEVIKAPMSCNRSAAIDSSKVCVMESETWQEYPTAFLHFKVKCFEVKAEQKEPSTNEEQKDINL